MDCLKSCNICVNTIMLPGSLSSSTYSPSDYPYTNESGLKLLFIPLHSCDDNQPGFRSGAGSELGSVSGLESGIGSGKGSGKGKGLEFGLGMPTYIPVLLKIGSPGATLFCIHFHGNACDIGEGGPSAQHESHHFNAHYLIVEYPKFGIANGERLKR
jgi:hypothetical protein